MSKGKKKLNLKIEVDDTSDTMSTSSMSTNNSSNDGISKILAELDREEVEKQAQNLMRLILEEGNSENFKNFLKLSKPLAIEIILEKITEDSRYSREIREIFENSLIEKRIGKVKNRPVKLFSNKDEGVTEGRFVKKDLQNNELPSLKHSTTWLEKIGGISGRRNIGEEICEYIGTNLMNQLLDKNSPKIRLYKDNQGNVRLMSKFIQNFIPLESFDLINEKPFNGALGLTNFFAANILFADYDTNIQNAGIRRDNLGDSHAARIDNGKALSYKKVKRPKDYDSNIFAEHNSNIEPTEDIVIGNIFRAKVYSGVFDNIDMANELLNLSNSLNINKLRKVIKLSLDNIEEAYGSDILSNPAILQELRERMEFPENITINRQVLENAIIENIQFMNNIIRIYAEKQVQKNTGINNNSNKENIHQSNNNSNNQHFQRIALRNITNEDRSLK